MSQSIVHQSTIIETLRSPSLLGALPAFRDLSSWRAWLIFLSAIYGLPLDDEQQHIFRRHTGRSVYDPPDGGWREVVCVTGRQSGKTRVAATIAAFEAIVAPPEPDGTETYCVLVAQDTRAALRTLFSYAVSPFDTVPALVRMVPTGWRTMWRKARRADSLTLDTGARISVYPCRPAAVRGIRARVFVCDELSFYRSSEGSPVDAEMLRAARPTLATTGGRIVVLSSPYAQAGALYELYRKHHGRDDANVLVWQASAPAMNPTLPADYLQRMEQDDPEAYRSEVLGEFRAGVSMFFDPDAITTCVESGARERAPRSDIVYRAFVDPSGGRADAFGLAIGHRDGNMTIVDVVRAWPAPHNPSGVIAEAAALCCRYGVGHVVGDRYGGEFPREAFRSHDITYEPSSRDRSDLYLDLLSRLNAREVIWPDDPATLRELRGLERRRGSSGRDRVDHAPGAHDDRAVVVAGVVAILTHRALSVPLRIYGGPGGAGMYDTPDAAALAARLGIDLEAEMRALEREEL